MLPIELIDKIIFYSNNFNLVFLCTKYVIKKFYQNKAFIKYQLKKHVKKYSIEDIKSKSYIYESFYTTDICSDFFYDDNVKKIFEWVEDEYSGTIKVIYKYKNVFIVIDEYFGSCGGCDDLRGCDTIHQVNYQINIIFDRCEIYHDLNEFQLTYPHPDFIEKFNEFKQNDLKIDI